MQKKIIFIDTNCRNPDGSYMINEIYIKSQNLKVGDKVIAYQDTDSWDARITYINNNWGVVIESESKEISQERYEGQDEGFWWGYCLERCIIINLLKKMDIPSEFLNELMKKLGIN